MGTAGSSVRARELGVLVSFSPVVRAFASEFRSWFWLQKHKLLFQRGKGDNGSGVRDFWDVAWARRGVLWRKWGEVNVPLIQAAFSLCRS